ncbi:MAG TPA: MMPL family transporter [Acidimicrobiia bacterium]|nr:MMPL family transporter [Acidimicrobiia bacterium]
MKSLVNALSRAVERAPWAVIIVSVVISMALGGLSRQFQPEEDSNASFAPEAPELDAADRIPELFGEESSTSVMQVIVTSEAGDVFTLDGFQATQAIEESVRAGAFAGILAEAVDPAEGGQPAVVSFMTPVFFAIGEGAPVPTSDIELKQTYANAIEQLPPEQAGLFEQLLPQSGDDKGLMIILTTGAESVDEFDIFVDQSALAAEEIRATELPPTISAEPFSFELLFSDQDEFQNEIARLLGTAVLIIALVLTLVFLLIPHRASRRWLMVGGIAVVGTAIVLSILPTLATVLDSAFPDAIEDWNSSAIFAVAGLALVVVLLAWSFTSKPLRRTAADTVITLITIFFAISWMNGFGYLIFEDASPMAQILPILLIGLGVDYSIHVTSRYREELSGGASVDARIGRAIKTVGVALVLATLTTAVGFLTNLTNDIPALREFGLLASIGIVASFILMLTFVPAVRLLLDRRAERAGTLDRNLIKSGDERALPKVIGRTSWLAKKAPVPVMVVTLVLGGVGFYGFTELNSEFSFLDFVPTTSPLRGTFETLLEDFGGGFGENTQVLIEGDVATADAWNEMVVANGNMAQTENVVTFGGFPAGTSPVASILQLGNEASPTFDAGVGQALQAAGADPNTGAVASGADVPAIYDAAFAADPTGMRSVLHQAGSGYDAALFDVTTQAGESGAGQLRIDTLDAFEGVSDQGLSVVATSDEIINDVIVTTLRDSQFQSLLITLAAAALLLVINFWFEARRPMLGLITTAPVVLVVLLSFAIMAAFGIPFGPVTATISALAIGIGIPYMIHITHRYLEDRDRIESPLDAIESTLTHTGGALAGSALTTVAGFGILITSTTIPFRQFGFVTAYTILLAMLGAVLVLPSMLVLWDRWHRNRGEEPFDAATLHDALQQEPVAGE